ncbi:Polyketide synthase dehydratase [Syntrophus gentianae]|uniref:Polyketide synthase dehydratase n=1 Tax=Syntrophus gentianae TaxID=43775 RepID=A0A1H7YIW3_9BACT|nr:polyketide synthase dehydratase domain-containing protein [Syntrophus gentianae]SEM45089.1 Polyketide synthase dehydratase [Syntrophus gentianae]
MVSFPLEIPLFPSMRDHAFDGKVMFSAAELLSLTAVQVALNFPALKNIEQVEALFSRFLLLPPEERKALPVLMEVEMQTEGGITARLLSRFQSRSGAISRLREHFRVRFQKGNPTDLSPPAFDQASELAGEILDIPAERIYEELIPFGPSYRNIRGPLRLNSQGAVALLAVDNHSFPDPYPDWFPGVPLIADAAFQAACIWGQRYAGRVVFPVGFRRRCFRKDLQSEGSYLCRVYPVDTTGDMLVFDLWIYERGGILCEAILGLQMKDVTAGRIKPPLWVQDGAS